MSQKYQLGYQITPHFRKLNVWAFDPKTKKLIGLDTCTPSRNGLTKKEIAAAKKAGTPYTPYSLAERKEVIRKKLLEHGIKMT